MTDPLTSPPEVIADISRQRIDDAMSSLAFQKEDAIKAALNYLMAGRSLDDVRRRCEMRIDPPTKSEFFCIDGDPVLQFYPIEFDHKQTDASYIITATQKVRKLK